MIRPIPFLALAILLAAAIAHFAGFVPRGDPFADPRGVTLTDLTRVPVGTVATLKLRHAGAVAPFDIGLFGNSRVLAVGAADIGLPDCRFFNFGLSGQSLRASVALVERLAEAGRLPGRVLVSFDNLALQFYGNPEWMPLWQRGRGALADLAPSGAGAEAGAAAWMRMAWRHLLNEGNLFRYQFEASFVGTGLRAAAGLEPDVPAAHVYRPDGSLPYADIAPAGDFQAAPPQILMPYLRADLERLARAAGERAIVYESPLMPAIGEAVAATAGSYIAEHRQGFLAACEAAGIACRAAPMTLAPDRPWPDASHAPAPALGGYLRSLLMANPPACAQ